MSEAASETKRGTVRRVFFCNPESPWMAGRIELDDGGEVGFSGKCSAEVGDKLELVGKWVDHPKFGRQFEAQSALVKMDESPDALVHLLSTRKEFEGLGPVKAKKVVDAAIALSENGEAISGLLEAPDEVAQRAGVSLEIVENAAKVWGEKREYFDALAQLVEQGWTNSQAQKIVAKLGTEAPAIVRHDPYSLIKKIARFGFRTVDVVARKLGVTSTDPDRLAAGIAYCLDQIANDGNTWTTRYGLAASALAELKPDTLDGEELIHTAIERLIQSGEIFCDVLGEPETEVVADASTATIEMRVFGYLIEALKETRQDIESGALSFDGPRSQSVLATLNRGQAKATWGAWTHRASVISGGAGVGKTYLMRAICEIAAENGVEVKLCAPTGKAARKLEKSTGREAKTIHRLLEPQFDEQRGEFHFTRNARNPIDAELVIVDEVSMVDVRLMWSLLQALPRGCRLLLVGDHHQIPSVGPGAILRDLLSAQHLYPGAVHVLTEIVRQAGVLARNTCGVLTGTVAPENSDVWSTVPTEYGDREGSEAIVAEIVEQLVTSPNPVAPFGEPLDLAWDVQVLSPMRKGPLGTYALNAQLQKLRQRLLGNPPPEPVEQNKPPKPVVGDRVIWTKNDYDLDLLNGTQARVMAFEKGGAMRIETEDGREVLVPAAKRVLVEVAWAITIHKSQGSDWPMIVLAASGSHRRMHDRNLFYTGASRASGALKIVGDLRGIQAFAREQRSAYRQTFGAYLVFGWQPTAAQQEEPAPEPSTPVAPSEPQPVAAQDDAPAIDAQQDPASADDDLENRRAPF